MDEGQVAAISEGRGGSGHTPRYGWVRFAAVVLLAFVVPVGLIVIGVIPFYYRFHVLLLSSLGLGIYAWAAGYGRHEIGVRFDNLVSSLALNVGVSIGTAAPLLLAYMLGVIRAPTVPTWTAFYPLYVLVFCPAQEFSCRALLFGELNRLHNTPRPVVQIVITAAVFAFIHIIYRDALTLLASFVMGLIWGLVFRLRPNLLGVSLSHAVLGFVSIMIGLI